MNEQSTKDNLIKLFISKFENSNTNEISIYKSDIEELGISEQEDSRTILLLQEDGALIVKHNSVHNDFSVRWLIALKSYCIDYFKNQKYSKIEKRRKFFFEFRAWITLLISMLAFGLSILSIYLQNIPKP